MREDRHRSKPDGLVGRKVDVSCESARKIVTKNKHLDSARRQVTNALLELDSLYRKGDRFMKLARRAIGLTMAGSLLMSAAVLAADQESQRDPAINAAQDVSEDAGASAVRVMRDPRTGRLRSPTSEEMKSLIEAEQAARNAARSARAQARFAPRVMPAQKSTRRHSNGMLSMRLTKESLTTIKAVPDADGGTRVVHDGASSQPTAQEK